ncbi:MAG: helix-turn-helix domain-containing protein [bacterium]|nr:helix-turn-helix domain-containing protein [bacterium]
MLLTDAGSRARNNILNELLTPTEKLVIAKRLAMIVLINKGKSVVEIGHDLGVSTSTVARFQLKVERGQFGHTIKWIHSHSLEAKAAELLKFVIASAFGKRGKSFKQMVNDL